MKPIAVLVALSIAANVVVASQSRPIDVQRSALTVYAFKSGMFSAFADDHVIRAPIAAGSVAEGGTPAVEIHVRSADLVALDPNLSASKRAEVQARMVGPEVLDVSRYPAITFASTSAEAAGPNRWMVRGTLTIHGTSRPVTAAVTRQDDHYRGSFTLKQTDFGIKPISIVGGTVKVKDELKIEFDVVTAN
jgi:hypothetical protein